MSQAQQRRPINHSLRISMSFCYNVLPAVTEIDSSRLTNEAVRDKYNERGSKAWPIKYTHTISEWIFDLASF